MALMYDWYETPDSHDKPQEEKLLYPRVCMYLRCTTESLCKEIEQMTTAHRADIALVLSALSDTLKRKLNAGYQVHLEGLGYFGVTLTTDEPVRRATERKWSKVRIGGIRFTPEKELKESIQWAELAQLDARHSRKLADGEIDGRLTAHFAEQPYLTRRDLQDLCQLTSTTAVRLLRRLVGSGKLLREGPTTHPVYVPAPGYYGKAAVEEENETELKESESAILPSK